MIIQYNYNSKQIAEEERKVILNMNSIDLENNLMNSSYLVLLFEEFFNEQTSLKQLSIEELTYRLFHLFSTWIIRPEVSTVHTYSSSYSYTSSSVLSSTQNHHSIVDSLPDSSLAVSFSSNEMDHTIHSSFDDIEKNRVIGRIDYEHCINELLPKYSKSQCTTQASRLFDKLAIERNVSKTMDGPCCNLFVLTYNEFVESLQHLFTNMNIDNMKCNE